jgi:hypothetical protein
MSQLQKEMAAKHCRSMATHGKRNTPEYLVWTRMRNRCRDKSRKYHCGRGITVCERWDSFENFLSDMGPRPTPHHSIDRFPDQNGNYEPCNCRWATAVEQSNNRSSNKIVSYLGKEMTLIQAIRAAGNVVGKHTARLRIIKHGWTVETAVETPPLPTGLSREKFARTGTRG